MGNTKIKQIIFSIISMFLTEEMEMMKRDESDDEGKNSSTP